jgi:hypothetical protein
MLHRDYYRKGYVGKKIAGQESQGAWSQDEVIGGKPPAVKYLWLGFKRVVVEWDREWGESSAVKEEGLKG